MNNRGSCRWHSNVLPLPNQLPILGHPPSPPPTNNSPPIASLMFSYHATELFQFVTSPRTAVLGKEITHSIMLAWEAGL